MVSAARTAAQLTALLWAKFDRTWRLGKATMPAEVAAIKDASHRIELVEYNRLDTRRLAFRGNTLDDDDNDEDEDEARVYELTLDNDPEELRDRNETFQFPSGAQEI